MQLFQGVFHADNLIQSLNVLVKRCTQIFQAEIVVIRLWRDGRFYSLVSSDGPSQIKNVFDELQYPQTCSVFLGQDGKPTADCLSHRMINQEFDISNSDQEKYHECQACRPEILGPLGIQQAVCFPLVHLGEFQGVITLFSQKTIPFRQRSDELNKFLPYISTYIYEQHLRSLAAERERALTLLLHGTEVLVKADSEDNLLAEAGEMAMEILFLEAGFFLIYTDEQWQVRAPFGRLKSKEKAWIDWFEGHVKKKCPQSYKPHSAPAYHHGDLESLTHGLPYPVKKAFVLPIRTQRGIIGELWLLDSQVSDLERSQQVLEAFMRVLGMALQNVHQKNELVALATTDLLTGILNRQGFEQRIKQEMAGTLRRGSSFLLLVLDLDGFKELNDSQGHPVGDAALRYLAQNLRRAVREQDIVSRTGGDEFTVVLTDMTICQESLAVIKRLKDEMGLEKYNLGVSIGVAEFPSESADFERLYRVADRRLYYGKFNGKGQVISG